MGNQLSALSLQQSAISGRLAVTEITLSERLKADC
jgi:hypothetical protein